MFGNLKFSKIYPIYKLHKKIIMSRLVIFLTALMLIGGASYGQESSAIRYKVTDYYPDPSNPATAVGMVIWVNPQSDGKHGLIVSLDEKELPHWSSEYVTTGSTDKSDGVKNMKTMSDFIKNSAGAYSWENFPAFQWCKEKNTGKIF